MACSIVRSSQAGRPPEGDRYETADFRTWQLRGGGFPAPYSSPLGPPLTDGQQRGTLFSCQSAFPATLSRSVTDEPRNSRGVLRAARRAPSVPHRWPMGTRQHQPRCTLCSSPGPLLARASGAAELLSGPPLTVAPLSPARLARTALAPYCPDEEPDVPLRGP
jgi:hypothetical protein